MIEILPLDEAIQRLKREILSQDWRLNEKRSKKLGEAFSCLQSRFGNRKAVFSILTMAVNVLEYKKKKGNASLPDAIDFLKEAMAHVVNLYEDQHFDPEKDERVFHSVYNRFSRLKDMIAAQKKEKESSPADEATSPARTDESGEGHNERKSSSPIKRSSSFHTILGTEDTEFYRDVISKLGDSGAAKLVSSLQETLTMAEMLSASLRNVLSFLGQEEGARSGENRKDAVGRLPSQQQKSDKETYSPHTNKEENRPWQDRILSCPPNEVREFSIGNTILAVQAPYIAAIKPLTNRKRAEYIKNSCVPLKDFARFMRNLSAQFNGKLAELNDGKLKTLKLPVMIPRGGSLAELPDEEARYLVFLSNGPWHGVVLTTDVASATKVMVKFQKNMDGDIVGKGYTREGEQLCMLSAASVLQREGFLIVI